MPFGGTSLPAQNLATSLHFFLSAVSLRDVGLMDTEEQRGTHRTCPFMSQRNEAGVCLCLGGGVGGGA